MGSAKSAISVQCYLERGVIQYACKKPLSAVQHGPEVLGEQLGFWWSAQPRWALDVLGRWSPWTCIWPYGIQLHGLLSWCSGSTSLWSLPAIHRARDGAPRWRSSLGPVRPVIAGDTAPKDLRELPQGGRREEGRRVSAIWGTNRNLNPRNCCQNCSECFWEWNWPTVSWLVAVTLRASDLWQSARSNSSTLEILFKTFSFSSYEPWVLHRCTVEVKPSFLSWHCLPLSEH